MIKKDRLRHTPRSFSGLRGHVFPRKQVYRIYIPFATSTHAFIASMTALLNPCSSNTPTASIVVPAGEHTMSLSSPGCFPVSRTIFALPRTACAANLYACALGIPSATAASAIASININTYAGELPQLINVLRGEMSFVGTRPEVVKYVKGYTKEMYATLLLPAGITSRASVCYKDEGEMLEHVEDVDYAYIHEVLPEKMSYNLEDLRKYSLWRDFMTMFMTVFAVLR